MKIKIVCFSLNFPNPQTEVRKIKFQLNLKLFHFCDMLSVVVCSNYSTLLLICFLAEKKKNSSDMFFYNSLFFYTFLKSRINAFRHCENLAYLKILLTFI